jgi:hypothetical protein
MVPIVTALVIVMTIGAWVAKKCWFFDYGTSTTVMEVPGLSSVLLETNAGHPLFPNSLHCQANVIYAGEAHGKRVWLTTWYRGHFPVVDKIDGHNQILIRAVRSKITVNPLALEGTGYSVVIK